MDAWTATAVSGNRQSTIVANSSFSVAALGTPAPITPSGTTPTDTPVFQWQPIMDASHTPAAHFSLKIIDASTGGTVFSDSNLKGTSFALPANHALTPGRNYRWMVTGVSANGRTSVQSSAMSFMVAPLGSPLAVVPNGSASTDMPTFQWTPVTDSSHTAPARFTIKILKAGVEPPACGYVQVLNLFYLCDKGFGRAMRTIRRIPTPPSDKSETKRFPWIMYLWGVYDEAKAPYIDRFERLESDCHFYFDKNRDRIIPSVPKRGSFAKHTQGMVLEPVIKHLASLIEAG